MKLTLVQFFFTYLSVFLAIVFISWFMYERRRNRAEHRARRIFICGCCGSDIHDPGRSLRLRCRSCGASQEKLTLKEKL
ncbi:MAG: hypothetical protein ACAI35_10000 [Candidatus Methylacidiphilales bacterium]|nr:hypothetical protein [Candidatus Methylacidiphilales bacterium]